MATPGNGVLLDTSIVVRHFRDGNALASKLAAYQELYLPQAVLAELYAGAFRSARPAKNLQQITRFLEAVDVLVPDESTSEIYGHISAQLAQAGTPIPQKRHLDRRHRAAIQSSAGDRRQSLPERHRIDRAVVVAASRRYRRGKSVTLSR